MAEVSSLPPFLPLNWLNGMVTSYGAVLAATFVRLASKSSPLLLSWQMSLLAFCRPV